MRAWRVMGNNLERNTWCEVDNLPNEVLADGHAIHLRAQFPDSNFFVQNYEEARTGKLEKRSEGT